MAVFRAMATGPLRKVRGWFERRGEVGAGRSLRHGRVYIRHPRGSDWREWVQLRAASRSFLTPWEPTWPRDALTQAAFRRRLRQYAQDRRDGTGYSFLIFRAGDDALLGGINITNIRRGIVEAGSLGYWIGAPYAGHGYMSEAMHCMLRFAFERLGLHRVEAACLPNNAASRALLRKSGFKEEGLARKYLRIDGVWRDHQTFAILRDDWVLGRRAGLVPPRGGGCV